MSLHVTEQLAGYVYPPEQQLFVMSSCRTQYLCVPVVIAVQLSLLYWNRHTSLKFWKLPPEYQLSLPSGRVMSMQFRILSGIVMSTYRTNLLYLPAQQHRFTYQNGLQKARLISPCPEQAPRSRAVAAWGSHAPATASLKIVMHHPQFY